MGLELGLWSGLDNTLGIGSFWDNVKLFTNLGFIQSPDSKLTLASCCYFPNPEDKPLWDKLTHQWRRHDTDKLICDGQLMVRL